MHRHCAFVAALLATACGRTSVVQPGDTLDIEGGDMQAGGVNQALASPLVVKATSKSGAAISGVTIAWSVVTGGGTITPASSVTGSDGTASATVTLGPIAGPQTFMATLQGDSSISATFTAQAAGGPAVSAATLGGSDQIGTVGQVLAVPLAIIALDSLGNPAPNASVTWVVASGGGSVSPAMAITGADGESSTLATLGNTAGPNTFTATVALGNTSTTLTFNATGTAGPAASIVLVSGNMQEASAGMALADALVVQVNDSFGNPVSMQTVNWAVTAGGGSINPMTGMTGENGQTSANATLGATAGANTFTANAGTGTNISFTETALATP